MSLASHNFVSCEKKAGRKSVVAEFPQVIPVVSNFVRENDLQANMKGGSETPLMYGTTNRAVQQEILRQVPEVKEKFPKLSTSMPDARLFYCLLIALGTASRLFPPPNPHSGPEYKAIINAKRTRIDNDRKVYSSETHENNAMQKNFDEMSTYFAEELIEVNADNKALISFNESAIDRRTQPNRLFSDGNAPKYDMHDFPQPEKCIPSAYMVRTPRTGDIEYYEDDLGRKRIAKNTSGPTYFFLRSSHFYESNIQCHINDLLELTKLYPLKGAMGLYVDNGTDWAFHLRSGKCSLVNIYEYGRFWLESRLSVFFVAAFVPENHHQGPIEHFFGPRTNEIAGAMFPLDLNDKSEEELAKEIDNSMDLIAKSWEGREYGGFPVHATVVSCKANPHFNDIDEIQSQFKSGNLNSDVKRSLLFFLKHLAKTPWTLLFLPCMDCEICLKTNWKKADRFYQFIAKTHAGMLPLGRLNEGTD